jgi:DNA ligase-1
MLFQALALTSDAIKQTRARTQKIERLAACIRGLGLEAVGVGVAYLAGQLPQGRIGLGPAAVFASRGGPAAAEPTLSVSDVDRALDAIKAVHGAGSVAERQRLWEGLLQRATAVEQQMLRSLVVGELRQGALESLVQDALARAAAVSPEGVRRATMLSGSLSEVARAAFEGGEAALGRYGIQLFRPLQPMLAHTAETPDDALARLGSASFEGKASLEYKLDGVRVQVHKQGDDVRVFTRHLKDITRTLPDVVERVRGLPADRLILDGEALALKGDGAPEPFQTTMRRFGRKLELERMRESLPLTPFFFDVLHVSGTDLIARPQRERIAALEEVVPAPWRVPRLVTADPAQAAAFFEGALDAGHEGVMAKGLDSEYAAGRRGQSWLKLKIHHTLDLVVLAVEWGSGRRQGWLSNLHLGARGPAGFVMVGKTFKGLTDELLRWQTEALLARESSREDYVVRVRPELVVEIAFNDVQVSPQYPGGVALRFARVRRYRPDKAPEEADTIDTIRALLPGARK